MTLPDPVQMATPAFIALVLIEMVAIRLGAQGDYDWRDSFTSLTMGFGSTMAAVIFGATIIATYGWAAQFRLFDIPVAWWSGALCFVAEDFLYYWFHRSAHRVRWFWASHVIHHSSQHYNLTTALRQPWTGIVSLSFAYRLPLLLIGFNLGLVLFCAGLNLIYQFWVHTETVKRLPFDLEMVLNTPSHHRVHHGTNPRYLDRNYGGVFIIWDRLFGTFEAECSADP
ncbi:MAG: sterol desaturase family protein, partial [Janthinobacterium lividum]